MNKYLIQCQRGAYVNNVQSNKIKYYHGRLQARPIGTAAHSTHHQHPMLLASSCFHYCYESHQARGRLHFNKKRSIFPCLHRASVVSKTLSIVPTDVHYYKIIEMLKQFKIITLASTCFGSRRNHHQGAVLCLAKITNMVFLYLSV